MSEPFIGEIIMFAGNFAPQGWAFCDGQILAISDNDALFSLIGTTYGGNGTTTFGLPDLRGRAPLHQGQGPGLSDRRLGQVGGVEQVTLTVNQLPSHGHGEIQATTTRGDQANAAGAVLGESPQAQVYLEDPASVNLNNNAIGGAGGNQPHNNIQPYQCINYIIALVGIYPSRS